MRDIKRATLTNRTFETIYVRSTLRQKLISEINRFKPVLITLWKKKKPSSETKQDTIEYLKSHSKGSEIYRLSCSTIPNNHGDRHFGRLWATFQKIPSYAPAEPVSKCYITHPFAFCAFKLAILKPTLHPWFM